MYIIPKRQGSGNLCKVCAEAINADQLQITVRLSREQFLDYHLHCFENRLHNWLTHPPNRRKLTLTDADYTSYKKLQASLYYMKARLVRYQQKLELSYNRRLNTFTQRLQQKYNETELQYEELKQRAHAS